MNTAALSSDAAYHHARNVAACDALKALLELHHGIALNPAKPEPVAAVPVGIGHKSPIDLVERIKSASFEACSEPKKTTMAEIQSAVCGYYDISRMHFLSHRRFAKLTKARHVSMYLCREYTDYSFPLIGKHHGGRDHTTILHGCHKIEAQVAADEYLAAEIADIVAILGIENAQADSSSLSRNENRDGAPEATEPKAHRLAEPIA